MLLRPFQWMHAYIVSLPQHSGWAFINSALELIMVIFCSCHPHNNWRLWALRDPHFWPKPMHLLFARPVIAPPMGESRPKCQGVSSPPLHDSSKLRGNPFSRPSVCVYCAYLNWSLQRHLWTYLGNVLGVKTIKVTPLHLLHTSTTFGANVSYRLQMRRTDRPTDQPTSLLYAIPWVWQWLSTSSLMWM